MEEEESLLRTIKYALRLRLPATTVSSLKTYGQHMQLSLLAPMGSGRCHAIRLRAIAQQANRPTANAGQGEYLPKRCVDIDNQKEGGFKALNFNTDSAGSMIRGQQTEACC